MIMRYKAIRILVSFFIILGIISANFALPQENVVAAPDCDHPSNAIEAENCLPGTPPSLWDLGGAGYANIQGYATDISVNQGETVHFKVDTDATAYRLDIYRLGYYAGNGARLIATVAPSATLPQPQPACSFDPAGDINLVDCGNWAESASWNVPATAVSGIYLAKLVREDGTPGTSDITFIVRNDDGHSDLLFQTSDTTWQAYNGYGDYSLYAHTQHAHKVSYNRPFFTRSNSTEDFLFNSEYPMIRWLERNGYDVSYSTDLDTDRRGSELLEHKVFLSVGHDEYWSAGQRAAVEAARNAGVNLAFFGGNEIYWKTRWEPSTDGSNTPNRTLVAYKDGSLANGGPSEHYNCYSTSTTGKCDPLPGVWTGLWRDGCGFSPVLDACKPENALSGNISWMGTTGTIQVPAADGKMRFWRNTSIASLLAGTSATLAANTLGYEWDFEQYQNSYPAGRFWLSTTLSDGQTHHLSLYRAPSGALVFSAGTVQWAWGLDGNHDRGSSTEDPRMQQATVNLFADMGVQPGSLQEGLITASTSTDVTPPSSMITSPISGSNVSGNVIISGTADGTGGTVGAVEVSVDGGTTWKTASGRESWTFSWTPPALGTFTIRSRAVDDSGNIETPSSGITLTVSTRSCPCTLWDPSSPAGPDDNDTNPSEVGVKFRSDVDGWVTGIRFYKNTLNTGTHIGNLWSSTGANLGSVVFTGETASGWQEATFATPVAVQANTTYVASYFSYGHYAASEGFFTSASLDNPPLHALQNGVDGSNGVYIYSSSSAFPIQTFNSSNYWVDLVFATEIGPDTIPPQVSSTTPANHAVNVALASTVAATFNEVMNPATITAAGNFELRDASMNLIPAAVRYDAPTRRAILTPDSALSPSASYTAVLKGGVTGAADLAGNRLASDNTWTFTTAAPPPLPPDEGPGGPILVIADASNAANPFGRFYAEILRAEGFNAYFVTDISTVTASTLSAYQVVLLGEMPLTTVQVSMFDTWVAGGGNLIAFKPAKALATLYGLTEAPGTTTEGYLAVNTSTSVGLGVAGDTLQFHGTADHYTLSGATSLATLYSDATTATTYPAAVRYSPGSGQVVIFTFDLARSIVFMRQGNPAWAGQEGDNILGIRASDMFVGRSGQPNWIDTTKLLIPQADEQMHVLSHAIEQLNAARLPLPRLWYFPNRSKGALILTGDSEGCDGTCINAPMQDANAHSGNYTVYLLGTGTTTLADVNAWLSAGNGVALHYDDTAEATNPTYAGMNAVYDTTTQNFVNAYGFAPRTVRNHWIVWTGWADQAKIEVAHGIGLDTNYYHYGSWLTSSGYPGYFTGSGLPLRFSDESGHILDIFQATTQLPDETWFHDINTQFKTLIDRSVDQGYYGFLTANFHPPSYGTYRTEAANMMEYANSRGVPIMSAEKLLDFLQARNQARMQNLAWDGTHLTFDFNQPAVYNGLTLMIPAKAGGHNLTSLQSGGSPVTFNVETVKGYDYAFFAANNGSYSASYVGDTTPPSVTGRTPAPSELSVALNANVTATFSEAINVGTLSGNTFTLRAESAGSDVPAGITYDDVSRTATLNPNTDLAYNTLYHVTIKATVSDLSNNQMGSDQTWSFTTLAEPPPSMTDTTVADFSGGTLNACVVDAGIGDGAVRLPAALDEGFSGTSLPAGWASYDWPYDGVTGMYSVSGGLLSVDGMRVNPDPAAYSPGTSLEFVATFAAAPFQHIGFGAGNNTPPNEVFNSTPWAMFSTGSSGSALMARTNSGAGDFNYTIPGNWLGAPHTYRIDWTSSNAVYFIDGNQVASQPYSSSFTMRPAISDLELGGGLLIVDWMRMHTYTSPCTFNSRVFDAGGTVIWGTFSWTGTTPGGTGLALRYRAGDTPILNGGWTAVPSSGDALSASSRYIQYQADLSASDLSQSPVLQDVTITYSALIPDTTPPSLTGRTPGPGAVSVATNANVTATFSEAMNAGTLSGSTFSLRADGAGSDISAVVTYDAASMTATLNPDADLAYATLYHVTVAGSVTDQAGNPLGSASTWSFTTTEAPLPVMSDTTAADFSAGSGNCPVDASIGDGALRLPLTIDEGFSSLPSDWTSAPWTGGTSTVSGGLLAVDGARFTPTSTIGYGPGNSIEFVATFGAAAYQNAGLGAGDNATTEDSGMFATGAQPWAVFGTVNTTDTLFARLNPGGDVAIANSANYIGSSHRYRIEWRPGNVVEFFIDGVSVNSRTAAFGTITMRPGFSDAANGSPALSVDWVRMTPYVSPCTFTSRVFDAGQPVNWDNLSWTSNLPVGTGLNLSYRIGSTPTLSGVEWTAFNGTSPRPLAGNSRYIQYQALLTSSNAQLTPDLRDVTFAYHTGADTTSPAISSLNAGPNSNGSALITWTTDEYSDSQVQYGATPDVLSGSVSSTALVTSHSVTLTGLSNGATYYYRVISKDAANNSTTFPLTSNSPASFTVPGLTYSLIDTSTADFSAGSGNCPVDASIGDGALRLPLTIDEGFSSLPSDWTSAPWTGGTSTVSSGVLAVDGARFTPTSTTGFGPGNSIEFVATFGAAAYQNAGLGAGDNATTENSGMFATGAQPWAVFGTVGTTDTLFARLNPGGDVAIANSANYIGSSHRYRIEWRPGNVVEFFIDGVSVDSRTAAFGTTTMRPGFSDYASGGPALSVDWVRMTPYVSPCAFTSRVFDAGLKANWNALSWTAGLPAGTSLNMRVRSGNTPSPDGSWTAFSSVAQSGDLVGSTSRYLQYQSELATTSSDQSPVLSDVTILYQAAVNHPPVGVNDSYTTPEDTALVLPAPGVLGNDSDVDGDPLTAVLVGSPAHGALTLNADGSFTFTPAANYNGADSFTYRANDGLVDSTITTVMITITPVNDAPAAVNDSYTTNENSPLSVTAPGVLGNDSDVDGDPLTAIQVAGPAHGALTLNANGSFTYTPDTGFSGDDSFSYKANDGVADSNPATVAIHVNAAPTPAHFSGQIHFDENPPAAGTPVQAWVTVGGQTVQVAATLVQGANPPSYSFDVPGDITGTTPIEGGVEGGTVTFQLNGRTMATAPWHSGGNTQLDFYSVALHLQEGWNLVSFNLVPVNSKIEAVLASLVGNYDQVYAWDASTSTGTWKIYSPPPVPPYVNTLTDLNEKMGFWIHMTAADTLDLAGSAPTTTIIPLHSTAGGWNLVGYPSVTPGALPNALSDHGVGDFSQVYAYYLQDTVPWKIYAPPPTPPYVNSLTALTPGWGYWVKVNTPATWTVSYP